MRFLPAMQQVEGVANLVDAGIQLLAQAHRVLAGERVVEHRAALPRRAALVEHQPLDGLTAAVAVMPRGMDQPQRPLGVVGPAGEVRLHRGVQLGVTPCRISSRRRRVEHRRWVGDLQFDPGLLERLDERKPSRVPAGTQRARVALVELRHPELDGLLEDNRSKRRRLKCAPILGLPTTVRPVVPQGRSGRGAGDRARDRDDDPAVLRRPGEIRDTGDGQARRGGVNHRRVDAHRSDVLAIGRAVVVGTHTTRRTRTVDINPQLHLKSLVATAIAAADEVAGA